MIDFDKGEIRHGMPAEEYHAVPAYSASGGKLLLRSAAHYRADKDADDEPSDALLFGTAFHLSHLEPEDFARRVVASPKFDRRTKAGKADAEAFEAEHVGKLIVTEAQYSDLAGMLAALRSHAAASVLFGEGDAEVSLFWRCAETGARCKARADFLPAGLGVCVDLKSTIDASPGGFARQAARMSYHLAAWHYLDGCDALALERDAFVLAAVEKAPPFAVGTYRVPDEALDVGRRRTMEARRLYAQCVHADSWPAYSGQIVDLQFPRWINYEGETE